MPPRWFCAAVIIVWAATVGWLAWSEVREEFGPDDPPPFVIDPTDDVQSDRSAVRWRVTVEDNEARSVDTGFVAVTQIEYTPPDDTFTFHLEIRPTTEGNPGLNLGLGRLKHMRSAYRITRDCRLLDVEASFTLSVKDADWVVDMKGAVRGGQFTGKYAIQTPVGPISQNLGPVPVARRGYVLMPMHPVHKVYGLYPGRTWKVPLLNPIADAVGTSTRPRFLHARVLPALQILPREDKETLCFVVEYEDDSDARPRTWVRASDGLVVRQEMNLDGQKLTIQRAVIPDPLP